MKFRDAMANDAAAIAALHAESWRGSAQREALSDEFCGEPLSADRRRVWDERMSSPAANQFVLLAEEAGGLVGFACAYGDDDERWGSLLDNLHVRRGRQGKGVGSSLLVRVAAWCATAYPERGMYLLVLESNAGARRLYERFGAADVASEVWDAPGGGRAASRRYAWTPEQVAALAAAVRW